MKKKKKKKKKKKQPVFHQNVFYLYIMKLDPSFILQYQKKYLQEKMNQPHLDSIDTEEEPHPDQGLFGHYECRIVTQIF